MALTVTLTGTTVTLDETAGLQNDDTNTALPTAFSSRLTALGAPATAINQAVSNGNVISISGVTGAIANLAFTDATGGALDGDASGLSTNDGEAIFLFTDTVDDNIVLGKTAAGAIAFAVYLEESGSPVNGGKFWSIQYEALEHPDATNPDDSIDLNGNLKVAVSEAINFGFAGAPSGANLFMTFGDPNGAQIVVIGQDPLNQSQGGNINTKDVLNISQAGGTTSFGVNGNQINPDEGAFITYVTGANTNFLVPNLDQNEADVEANIAFQNVLNASAASFTVNQTNPPVGPVTVKISAFTTAAEPGVNFVDGLANDAPVTITSASVVNNNGGQTPVVSISGGVLTVTGLNGGDVVRWTTSGTHNRVLLENISNADGVAGNDNNTFDIGGFSLTQANAASAVVGTAVHFEDDGPTAAIVQGAATVAHDETAGIQADADDTTAAGVVALFAGVSNVSTDLSPSGFAQDAAPVVSSTGSSFGTDSVGGTTAFSLDVSAAGVDSGLDTTGGTSIFLFKEGNLVVGRIGGAAGAAAFAVAINSTSGVVSMAQYASLKHPDATNPDESVSITESALQAVVTVTDGDGDKATSSTGIGDAVQFQDDGPTAGIVQGAPTVAHDETAGIQADADDTTAAAVVALFAGVSNVSSDLSPTGFAQDATPVVSSTGSSFGADQEGGTTAFSLAVSAAGVDSGLDTTNGTGIFLFKEGDLVVGRIGGAGGAAAFAVAIDSSSGAASVAQYASLKHPDATNPDESVNITDSALQAVVTVIDGDGDKATASTGIGDAVQFQDDGPTAAIVQGAATVAHDETAGIQADADDTTAAAVVALFAGVSNVSSDLSPTGFAQDATPVVSSTGSSFGADQEGGTTAFSLAVSAAGVDSGLDTTNGTSIFLFKEGNLVVGRIGSAAGAAAFAVAIDSTSGVVSLAQYASLKHPDATNADESVNIADSALQAVVTVTDGDGDKATSSTGIGDAVQFQDDAPAIGPVADGLVDFADGSSVTKALNGVVGADDPATYSITSSPATLTILDGTSSQVTLLRDITNNGTVVTYFKDDGDGIHDAGDTDFFKLTLSGGNYTFDVLENPPPAELNFNFAGAPSGSNLFMTFGSPSTTQIVVIGEDPLNQSKGGNINTEDVLNISQAGGTTSFGVNGNQINPNEGAFITYVTGANTNLLVPNLDQNEADIEANIDFQNVFDTTSASFTVNQTNPGKGPVAIKISAFDTDAEPGVNFVDGLTNDTHVNIASGSVVNFVVSGESNPVATVDADGNLIVTGLTSGDKVQWTTSGTHNRVLIENISNADSVAGNDNNTFDIGGFGLTQAQPAPDEKLDFTVQIADADGDTANDSFSIGIDGTGIFNDNNVDGVIIA